MRTYAVIALSLAVVAPQAASADQQACRAVTLINDTTGEVIVGAEDIAVDYEANLAYISAYDRRRVEEEVASGETAITAGGIYRLDLEALEPFASSTTVSDATLLFKQEADFRPHGIDLRGDQVLAVNRAYQAGGESVVLRPAIERFRIIEGGWLEHVETLRPEGDDELMCSPNDVLAREGEDFLVSNDHGACSGFARTWEEVWAVPKAHLVQYRHGDFGKYTDGLAYPNGLAANGDLLIVSETRQERLRVYQSGPDGPEAKAVIGLPGSPDNLSWAEDGRLLVAVIPDVTAFGFYRRGWFGVRQSASRIVAVSPPLSAKSNVETVFEDDGSLISAATVMAEAREVWLIGAVLDDHIVVCSKDSRNE